MSFNYANMKMLQEVNHHGGVLRSPSSLPSAELGVPLEVRLGDMWGGWSFSMPSEGTKLMVDGGSGDVSWCRV
jgi:hypothetical protein